ncbi:hypothetical protein ABID26_004544 [Mesorhizobium shonense]|uniref:Ferric uptake regulation protein n=1 Tax=Mesorhizobium shonense TaxID=1209948 RepID=A0ABV2HYL2_9HYPH
MPLNLVSTLFIILVAVATAEAVQIVGALLVFAVMVAPGATALRLTRGVLAGIRVSIALAIVIAWVSLWLAFLTDWPTSFWIAALGATAFLISGTSQRSLANGTPGAHQEPEAGARGHFPARQAGERIRHPRYIKPHGVRSPVLCAGPHAHCRGTAILAACERCGRVTKFCDDVVDLRLGEWSRRQNFQIGVASLELSGPCANCLAEQTEAL